MRLFLRGSTITITKDKKEKRCIAQPGKYDFMVFQLNKRVDLKNKIYVIIVCKKKIKKKQRKQQ